MIRTAFPHFGPAPGLVAAALLGMAAYAAISRGPGGAPAAVSRAGNAPELTAHGPRFAPAEGGAPAPASVPADFDVEIARLGARQPVFRERLRERYVRADDLYGFMQRLLPDAESGERVSQFYLYLTLDQCQMYLRLDAAEAQAVADRMMLLLNDQTPEERVQWQSEYQRCRAFAGADLTRLRAAMGDELPGAESEYASIWFQRSAQAGYPPALAEGALRINTLAVDERIALLEEALGSGDAEVYWMLFYHSPGDASGTATPAGVAWLILACRAGYDCTRGADWFRGAACLQEGEDCEPGESALGHFWYRLPAHERDAAWRLAGRIERDRLAGRLADMPWPELGRRNIVELRAAEGLDTPE
jgi:hypothetical protein